MAEFGDFAHLDGAAFGITPSVPALLTYWGVPPVVSGIRPDHLPALLTRQCNDELRLTIDPKRPTRSFFCTREYDHLPDDEHVAHADNRQPIVAWRGRRLG